MSRSRRLRLSDVRAIFRLLDEIRELGADPRIWRRHMLESLCRFIDAQAGVSAEVLYPADVPRPVPESFADFRCPSGPGWQALMRYLAGPEARSCPACRAVTRWHPGGRTGNYSRGRIEPPFDERSWRTSTLVGLTFEAGLDLPIHSRHPFPVGRAAHVVTLYRIIGEKPFTSVETRLVRLFHAELSRLWRLPSSDGSQRLPRRLQQTLDGLLAGAGEKQIASRLDLSRHTVHNYVKELHRRFGVSSRSELLSRYANSPRRDLAPRLTTLLGDLVTRKTLDGVGTVAADGEPIRRIRRDADGLPDHPAQTEENASRWMCEPETLTEEAPAAQS